MEQPTELKHKGCLMKVYRKKYGIKKAQAKPLGKIRKVYTDPNAALAWELDFKGVDYDV